MEKSGERVKIGVIWDGEGLYGMDRGWRGDIWDGEGLYGMDRGWRGGIWDG